MVRCNLALLLTERNLKITKVSADTGISRTTLTTLTNNYGQGIQFGTLNTLCNYLNVTPDKFFLYVPFDIIINNVTLNEETLLIDCFLFDMFKEIPFRLKGIIEPVGIFSNNALFSLAISLFYDHDYGDDSSNRSVIEKFGSLPLPFFKDLEQNILSKSMNFITEKYGSSNTITCYWDAQFQA